jgi:hypothetical protein
MKPLVYVAGAYSSNPTANTAAAVAAGMRLWRTGLAVPYIPHLSIVADLIAPMPVEDWYRFDLEIVDHCDAVWRLDGESKGVDAEVAHARERGIPVFRSIEAVAAWAGIMTKAVSA